MPAAGPAREQVPIVPRSDVDPRFAEALEAFVAEVRKFNHHFETVRQFVDQRAGDLQPQVAPTVMDAVAFVFRGDVKPADERHLVIADQQLPMVAVRPPPQRQGIEPAEFPARLDQGIPETARQRQRTKGIHQHAHVDAALPGLHQGGKKGFPAGAVRKDVGFQTNGPARVFDGRQHGGIARLPADQPTKTGLMTFRHSVGWSVPNRLTKDIEKASSHFPCRQRRDENLFQFLPAIRHLAAMRMVRGIVLGLIGAWIAMAVPASMAALATQARLVLSDETARPGDTVWAGVELKMADHWHTYWRNGGDAGGPTEIAWTLPEGIKAGPIQWPVPEKYVTGPITTYVYSDRVMLLVPLTLASNLPPGPKAIKAKVSWLECSDLCVPGDAELSAKLVVGNERKASSSLAVDRSR